MSAPAYTPTIRQLFDRWLGSWQLRYSGFGEQMAAIHGWLQTTPPHMTGAGREITEPECRDLVFAYFHDPDALYALSGYAGGLRHLVSGT